MKKVNSALGPIDTKDIGYALMHEHILAADWSMRIAFKDWIIYDEFIELAVREVNKAKKNGIKTIVDGTPINLGRDILALRDVAAKTGVHIIASTGFYSDETMMLGTKSEKTFVKLMLREIEVGMQGTDTKAGIIKVATDQLGVTELNRKFLKAAALANKETGIPIYTHTAVNSKVGLDQQDVFEDEGIDLSNVVIGHCGDCNDFEYMEKLMKRGSYIGLDRFGPDEAYRGVYNLEDKIKIFIELCKRGWIDKIIVSHDFSCFFDGFDNEWDRMKDLDNLPCDFCYFNTKVIPKLIKGGISKKQIDTVMIDNPRRFFEK